MSQSLIVLERMLRTILLIFFKDFEIYVESHVYISKEREKCYSGWSPKKLKNSMTKSVRFEVFLFRKNYIVQHCSVA